MLQLELQQQLQECYENALRKEMGEDEILAVFMAMTCYLLNQKRFCLLMKGKGNGSTANGKEGS